MKMKIFLLALVILVCGAGLIVKGWSQSEAVHGYYDPANDWFVFEWDNPDYGKRKTIYDPSNKVKPVIKAKVNFDQNRKEYTYDYEIENQHGAIQPLNRFFVKHLAPIYDAKTPDPQEDWDMGEYRDKSAWEWVKIGEPPTGIMAGHVERGFSFKSQGLPVILNSAFLGEERAMYSIPGDFDTDEVHASFDRVLGRLKEQYKEKFVNYIIKKTLGPKAPPEDFKAVSFIDYIISMKHEAFSLGWITNQGVVNSLDAKLENAKKKIEQGNIEAAKNILEALINEVEAQNGKHLTSEAYGLLKYNVEYLISKL